MCIPCPGHNIIIALPLLLYKLFNVLWLQPYHHHEIVNTYIYKTLYVMGHVSIHDDDKIAGGRFHAMHISRPKTKFARSRSEQDLVIPVDGLQLTGNLEGTIRGAIINDDNFVIINVLAIHHKKILNSRWWGVPGGEAFDEEVHDYWQVCTFIVGGQEDAILVDRLGHGGQGREGETTPKRSPGATPNSHHTIHG